jgi:hypothetical protein
MLYRAENIYVSVSCPLMGIIMYCLSNGNGNPFITFSTAQFSYISNFVRVFVKNCVGKLRILCLNFWIR